MRINNIRIFFWLFAYIMIACFASAQQYSVTGGAKDPYLAVDDSREHIKVYLVYGMDNVQISYTSSSTSHKWYRYKTKVDSNNPEAVSSVQQNGTTSVITNIEEGYGYYVLEESVNVMNRYYVWVIDYSKYEFDIRSLNISPNVDQCAAIRFDGDADIRDMLYFTPALGTQEKVKREFFLSYGTLEWNNALKQFFSKSISETFSTDPFSTSFAPPLTDTEITLSGDMFARHFGVEKSITISYQAVAIQVYADTLVISSGSGNNSGAGEGELQAPADINFKAYANFPVASYFEWKIYREDDTTRTIAEFSGEEYDYLFNRSGKYIAKLEVRGRSNICITEKDAFTFLIDITETEMLVPNAFSPGTTPGINDIFKVKYKSVMNFKGWVYNRWGNELFHWIDPAQGWDGKYRGKYVPAGAYYYTIEYTGTDGKKRVKKGDINVFRGKTIENEIVISDQ